MAVSPLNTEFSHTYRCRSIEVGSEQPSAYWNGTTKACEYNATLTVWNGGTGPSPVAGSVKETTVQRVEVRNNAPTVAVNPATVFVSSGAEATMNAIDTTDKDGVADDLEYSWDFGDPNTGDDNFADTMTATHRYDLPPGTSLEAVLTVTDDDGESVVVRVPVLVDVAEPTIIMEMQCRHDVQGTADDNTWTHFNEDCLRSDKGDSAEPWLVRFKPYRTAVSGPGAALTHYRWEFTNQPDMPMHDPPTWEPISGGLQDRNEGHVAGSWSVKFSVRTNQTKLDGSPVEADWYAQVDVNIPPSAITRFSPGPVITPTNRLIAGHEDDAARFVLDGSSSTDPNPGGGVSSYVWKVFNSSGTEVYSTPVGLQNRPIIGCDGFQTPPAENGDPWTISDYAIDGTSLSCPQFVDLGPGTYTATITVTNNRGKVSESPPATLKVNRPPTNVDVVDRAQLQASLNSTCYDAIESSPAKCVYRKRGRLFTATTPSDPDGSPPFEYDWKLTGDQDSSALSSTSTLTHTFMKFGENVEGMLTVTDGDGGITQRPFRFTVQNQNPKADIGVVAPGPAPSPAAAMPLNVFTDLTPADPGTVTLSSGVTADSDTSAAMTCRWIFSIDATPANDVEMPPRPCSENQSFSYADHTTQHGTYNVKLWVTDTDSGTPNCSAPCGTTLITKQVKVLHRPIAKFKVAPDSSASGSDVQAFDVKFDPTDSVDPNPGAGPLTYWWNLGEDCDAAGLNCKITTLTQSSGTFTHRFDKATCSTGSPPKVSNTGSCGKWKVYMWAESSLGHAPYGGTTEPGSPPPNGWSNRSDPLEVRLNRTPKVIFGGLPDIDSRVSSPIGPDGSSALTNLSNTSIAAASCGSGPSCLYHADARQSYDLDGSRNIPGVPDYLTQCTGPTQSGAVPADTSCLTYAWSVESKSPSDASVVLTGQNTATPQVTYNRPAGVTSPNGGSFILRVTVTDFNGGLLSRRLHVTDVKPPTVGPACISRAFGSIPRGVDIALDGRAWGKAGSSTGCATVTQDPASGHFTGAGQLFNGPEYSTAVDIVPSVNGNPASLIRATGSFLTDRFAVGTKIEIRETAPNPDRYTKAIISGVTDSTLTFSSTDFPLIAGTAVSGVSITSTCGGTTYGLQCIPDNVNPAGTGINAPNYVWTFVDNAGPGGECNRVVYGRAATVNFRPSSPCNGTVTLKVTDETGAASAPSLPATFSVGDSPPVANVDTTAPQVTSNAITIVANSIPYTLDFDGSSSYDPDGGPGGGSQSAVTSYAWNFGDPGSGANNTSTLAAPSHTFSSYGTFNVQLTVTDAGGLTTTRPVTVKVYQKPTVDISASASSPSSCTAPGSPTCTVLDPGPYNVSFSAINPLAFSGATVSSYSWNFGDPASGPTNNVATGPGPHVHPFSAYGVYVVTLTVTDTNGIEGTRTALVTVDEPPDVVITAEYEGAIGTGLPGFGAWYACPAGNVADCSVNQGSGSATVRLTAAASSAFGGIGQYNWNFGEPPVAPSAPVATHTFTGYGTRTVTLEVLTNLGASTTVTFTIKVNELPTAVIRDGATANPTSLSFDRNVDDTDLSGTDSSDPDPTPAGQPDNGIASWTWTFVDAVSGGPCTQTFTGKTPTINLAPAVSCSGTMRLTTVDSDQGSKTGASVPFTVTPAKPTVVISTNKANDIGSLPDGDPGPTPTISLIGGASFQPGGGSIASHQWVVQNAGGPTVSAASCLTNPAQPACVWVDDSGTNSTVTPPLVAGQYVAWLVVTTANGQTNEGSYPFEVNAPPTARITGSVLNGNGACPTVGSATTCEVIDTSPTQVGPYAVAFTDASSKQSGEDPNLWTRSWDFGDPASDVLNTSDLMNPVHTFTGYGTYVVTLTVTDTVGASSTTTALVTVRRPPTASISATYSPDSEPTLLPCTGNAVSCSVNDGTGEGFVNFMGSGTAPDGSIVSYEWDFGDSSPVSSAQSPTHHFTDYGTYTVTLTVTDDANSRGVDTFTVKVNRLPSSAFTDEGAAPSTVTLLRNESSAALNASSSSDPDPTPVGLPNNGIEAWSWAFIDDAGVDGHCNATVPGKNPTVMFNPPQVSSPDLAACKGVVELTVTDYDGGKTTGSPTPFVVNNVKPVAVVEATSEITGVAPSSPTFSPAGSNDPDTVTPSKPRGDIATYRWTVYKGGVQYRPTHVQSTFSDFLLLEDEPLTEQGEYSVELVVVDTHGTPSEPVVVDEVQVVGPPEARVTLNSPTGNSLPRPPGETVPAGAVVLDGGSSLPSSSGAPITLYSWEVCKPDSSGTACDPSVGAFHVYPVSAPDSSQATVVFPALPGINTYIVQLTVQDDFFVTDSTDWLRLEVSG